MPRGLGTDQCQCLKIGIRFQTLSQVDHKGGELLCFLTLMFFRNLGIYCDQSQRQSRCDADTKQQTTFPLAL